MARMMPTMAGYLFAVELIENTSYKIKSGEFGREW